MKGLFIKLVILTSALILFAGCSSSNLTTSKDKGENTSTVSSKTNSKNVKTIKTFLERELTTTNELKEILNSDDIPAQNQYLKETYGSLIANEYFEKFVNTNLGFAVLLPAHSAGYELKPTNMDVQLENSKFNSYTFKAEVECSKDGKTNTSTITGYMTLNDQGKISGITRFDFNDLQEIFHSAKAK
ncbi:hypothetical protein [Bacillus sp. FJAT-49736]|uniref:hypothetical protein n=1 Tax=Bacillus sp. FJAT-49736 TaxID=2833582 RepID=UPI001BCA100B|nr:hypothetical protein [Bacillus sp. FJAT-49736]MBS4172921.1 hypothetical protein [Bacillus sp. FJAT-49736]